MSCHLEEVKTLTELLSGEWVVDREGRRYWSFHHDAVGKGIAVAINKAIENQTCCKEANRLELRAYVIGELTRILNQPAKWQQFLSSPNRGGHLHLMARNLARNWMRARIRRAKRDKHLKAQVEAGVPLPLPLKPKEDEDKELQFDRWQFAGRRRAKQVSNDDTYTPHRRAGRGLELTASELKGGEESTLVSLVSTYTPEGTVARRELAEDLHEIKLIRKAIATLPEDDQQFIADYIRDYRRVRHTDAERKRLQRLVPVVKANLDKIIVHEEKSVM